MTIGPEGEGLIFLISQPRAGSTLLQRILGGHSMIHTVSEPWIMLPPLYALRPGSQAEYGADLARNGLVSFLEALPEGEKDYFAGMRRMYTYLYGRALEQSAKPYFLDKTPRYYLVIPQLAAVFPQARFIILLRNPLAVLSSIVSTWTSVRRLTLGSWHDDLFRAPQLLLDGIAALGERALVVHYEQLITSPDSEITRICQHLGLPAEPGLTEYGKREQPRWRQGDQTKVYSLRQPDRTNVENWTKRLRHPRTWQMASAYLRVLGERTTRALGYSYDELHQELQQNRPDAIRRALALPAPLLLRRWEFRPRLYARTIRNLVRP